MEVFLISVPSLAQQTCLWRPSHSCPFLWKSKTWSPLKTLKRGSDVLRTTSTFSLALMGFLPASSFSLSVLLLMPLTAAISPLGFWVLRSSALRASWVLGRPQDSGERNLKLTFLCVSLRQWGTNIRGPRKFTQTRGPINATQTTPR